MTLQYEMQLLDELPSKRTVYQHIRMTTRPHSQTDMYSDLRREYCNVAHVSFATSSPRPNQLNDGLNRQVFGRSQQRKHHQGSTCIDHLFGCRYMVLSHHQQSHFPPDFIRHSRHWCGCQSHQIVQYCTQIIHI